MQSEEQGFDKEVVCGKASNMARILPTKVSERMIALCCRFAWSLWEESQRFLTRLSIRNLSAGAVDGA
jgi:hypothetical protein